MPDISMKNMLEAGVHFGHQTHRWNPKMKGFIFGPRNGIYIIDLEKTVRNSKEACTFVKQVVAEGGKILFVATKKQAAAVTKEHAERVSMPYVTDRWLGGTLTNFATIRRGVEKLEQIERWKVDGTYDALKKKETVMHERKRIKLEASLGGIRHMRSLPSALFVIDPENERIAVKEAKRLGIPVVALVDTNCNPDPIDYVIPGNDDALKSVTLFVNLVADSCKEGSELYEARMRNAGGGAQVEAPVAPILAPVIPTGPIVEVVTRGNKKLRITTDEDLVDDNEEEAVTPAAPAADAVVEDVPPTDPKKKK